jgi:hypothetical protein
LLIFAHPKKEKIMRYLFTCLISVLSFVMVSAADRGGCGTPLPSDYQHSSTYAERMNYIAQSSSRGTIRWVGVQYHIVTKDDGSLGGSVKDILDNHCELNAVYNQFNIGFYITGIDTIKNTTLWTYQTSLGYGAFRDYNVANVANVYVNGNLPGLCGFATFPSGTSNRQGGVFLNKACVGAGDKTLAHELGHYFNLMHTFETANGVEFVDGSNCATAGDGFCDTPADFLDARTACPYTGTQTDPHGDLYSTVIDESLLMSYFDDNCVTRFSNEEQAEMNSTLGSRRAYLLNQPMPDVNPLDSAVFLYPVNGDTTLNSTPIVFKWRAVPRAQYYLLRVQSATSALVVKEVLISDTTYTVTTMLPSKSYKFRVKPISFGNTCGDNAPYQFIQTASIKTTLTVATPNCPGGNDAVVSAVVSNGTAPYSFLWSNGTTGSVLTNVPSGAYSVTITDNKGEIEVAEVQVAEPDPLSVNISKVGNNLTASGIGGTAPYTYLWSNAITGPGNNSIGLGTYSVTITDAKGCTTSQAFVVSGIGVDLETKVSMKIFPNPAAGVSAMNVQLTLNERTDGILSLVTINGAIIQHVQQEFSSGINTVPLNIEQLSSGIYFVQFKSKDVTRMERVSIIN